MKKIILSIIILFLSGNCFTAERNGSDINNSNTLSNVILGIFLTPSSLTLTSSSLTDGATDIGISPSWTFTFSSDINSTSVSSTNLVFTSSDATHSTTGNFLVSGATLTVYPKEMLQFSKTYSIKITGIISKSGAALSGEITRSFTTATANFGNFINGSNSLNISSTKYAYYPDGVFHNGSYYVSFIENNGTDFNVILKSYDGSSWTDRSGGGNNISYAPSNSNPSIFPSLYSNGENLYVAWSENTQGYPFGFANYWNGSTLNRMGTSSTLDITSDGTTNKYMPKIIQFNSEIYSLLIFINTIKIYKYSSTANSWSFIAQRTASVTTYPSWVEFNGKIYIFSLENSTNTGNVYKLLVHKFDGSSISTISSTGIQNLAVANANFDGANNGNGQYGDGTNTFISIPRPIVFNNKLYIGWSEGDNGSGGNYNKIRVKVYNGDDSNPSFTTIDNGGLNYNKSADAIAPSLAVYNNRLFATWSESDSTRQIRVAAYNGDDTSPNWAIRDSNSVSNLGLNKSKTNNGLNPVLISGNSGLIIAWVEDVSSIYTVWPLKLPY